MKKFLLIITLIAVSLAASAQDYYGTENLMPEKPKKTAVADSIASNNIYRSGKFLKYSASFQGEAIACTTASAVLYTLGANKKDNKKVFNIAGTVFAVAAVASEIASIVFKNKAGTELEISAGRIALKF